MAIWIKIRLGFVYFCFVIFFVGIGLRLFQLQLWKNSGLDELAQRQYVKLNKKAPYRQPILDRNGEELAVSMPAMSVFAHPKQIKARRKTAVSLAKILGGSPKKWLGRLDRQKSFVWIHRQINETTANRLIELKLPGIYVEAENRRFYPNGNLAAQTLGFTDIDGNGIAGVELFLNRQLLEPVSRVALSRDGRGNLSYLEKNYGDSIESRGGVRLTLDRRIQSVVDEELEKAEALYGGKKMMAIVVDPHNGEILAMGQRPLLDSNHPNQTPVAHTSNVWISHLYEPGSTLKPIFAAEAIEQGLLKADSKIDCEQGHLKIGKMVIHEAETHHQFGSISLSEVIQYSSNAGASKVAMKLGVDRMKRALEKFGLTKKTEIALPGEVVSPLKSDEVWKPFYQATVGFGQGLSVTPLQMVMAYAPFANEGYRVRPKILLSEIPSTKEAKPKDETQNRFLSSATLKSMREILTSVTEGEGGTGVKASFDGIKVAGKTGTAQKYETGKGYDTKKYLASFIGFMPADKPQLLIGVMIDEPQGVYYGGSTAAPVFKNIAQRSLQILDKLPRGAMTQNFVKSPKNLPLKPGLELESNRTPEIRISSEGNWYMPNLKGLSMREALKVLGEHVTSIKMAGDGFVDKQIPDSGAMISPQTEVNLHFSPEG